MPAITYHGNNSFHPAIAFRINYLLGNKCDLFAQHFFLS
jgi:hypothetical protein